MNVTVKYESCGIDQKFYPIVNKFIKYLQTYFPLEENLEINFIGRRQGKMTTASRMKNFIKVFCTKRILRDILRSLAHEWYHEYEDLILNIPHKKHIGGKNEDLANAKSGMIIKKFEYEFPDLQKSLYS